MEPQTFSPTLPPDGDPYWNADDPGHKAAVAAVQQQFRTSEPTSASASMSPDTDEIATAHALTASQEASAPQASTVEPYTLKAPPTLDGADARDFIADSGRTAAEIGLSKELAQELLTAVALDAELPTLPTYSGSPEAAERTLQGAWGGDYADNIALARWSYKNSPPRLQKALDASGLGNDPRVIRYMARDGARAALDAIYGDSSHLLFDSASPDHNSALATVRWLNHVLGR